MNAFQTDTRTPTPLNINDKYKYTQALSDTTSTTLMTIRHNIYNAVLLGEIVYFREDR